MNKREKRLLLAEIGRAIEATLSYQSDGAASEITDEQAIALATSGEDAYFGYGIADIVARAAAVTILRRLSPPECQIVERVIDGLLNVDDGNRAEIFSPRRRGNVIGAVSFHQDAHAELCAMVAKSCAYARGVLDRHDKRVSDDAAMALVLGVDRKGEAASNGMMRPVINLAGRSWRTARRLRDTGRSIIGKDELRRWEKSGKAGQQSSSVHRAEIDAIRNRFSNERKADNEFSLANVPSRKSLRPKGSRQV